VSVSLQVSVVLVGMKCLANQIGMRSENVRPLC
jgi:hypothetical protein